MEDDMIHGQQDEIAARIEEGWAAAERGEVADAEQVQARMRQRKQNWIEQQHPA